MMHVMKSKKIVSLIIRYLGLGLSLWLLYMMVDINALFQVIEIIPWYILLAGLLLVFLRMWLLVERWILLSPEETGLSRWMYFKMILASGSVNLFIPGIIGSDVVRSMMVTRQAKGAAIEAFLSVYLDRIIGLISILIMGLIAVIFSPELNQRSIIVSILVTILLALLGLVWLSRHPRVHQTMDTWLNHIGRTGHWLALRLNKVTDAVSRYRPSIKRIVYALLICFPIHGIWFTMVWMVGMIIGADVSFFLIALITTLVWIITMLPLTVAGIGLREVSFVYLLSIQGVTDEQSALMALFQSGIIIIVGLIGLPLLWKAKL